LKSAVILLDVFKKYGPEALLLPKPNCEGNVWPNQHCPAFTPRGSSTEKECWYCIFADFHLDKPNPLDVGICCYPNTTNTAEKR